MSSPVSSWLPALTPHRLRQVWYAPLLALAMGLMMVRLLVMARLLDVAGFGAFSGGILVSSTFCMLGCLGLQSMLQREWPVRIVRRQERRALVLAMQGWLVAAGCAFVAAVWLPILPWTGMSGTLLLVGVVHGLSQQVFLLATVDRRSRGDAVGYAWQNLSRAGLAFVLSVLAAHLTASALWALWVDAVATFALAWRFFAHSLARAFTGARGLTAIAMQRLPRVRWRSALTLMTIGIVGFVQLNVDRWLAAGRLDVSGFAQYSFAWIVLSMAQSAQAVVGALVHPALARRYAAHGSRVAFGTCLRASVALLVVGICTGLLLVPVLKQAAQYWYPGYGEAVGLIPLFLGIGVLRVSDFWSGFLIATGHEHRLLLVNVLAMALALVVWLYVASSPRDSGGELLSVGWLAAFLSALSYLGVVAASWGIQKG